MQYADMIGTAAGVLTTSAFLPQVIKVYRTRHTKDLSLFMYIIFLMGISLWTIYGMVTHSTPVIVANSITFVLASYILVMKLIYK